GPPLAVTTIGGSATFWSLASSIVATYEQALTSLPNVTSKWPVPACLTVADVVPANRLPLESATTNSVGAWTGGALDDALGGGRVVAWPVGAGGPVVGASVGGATVAVGPGGASVLLSAARWGPSGDPGTRNSAAIRAAPATTAAALGTQPAISGTISRAPSSRIGGSGGRGVTVTVKGALGGLPSHRAGGRTGTVTGCLP